MIKRFFKREEGATMVEYALMVALIAVVALVAVQVLGTNVSQTFSQIAAAMPT